MITGVRGAGYPDTVTDRGDWKIFLQRGLHQGCSDIEYAAQ